MTDKEAILERHSVRLCESKRIEAEKCEKIRNKIDELNAEGNLHLQFVEDAGKAFNSLFTMMAGLKSAPSVVVCAGPASDNLEEKGGLQSEEKTAHMHICGMFVHVLRMHCG